LFKVGRDVKIVYDQSESESLINENKSISGALQISKSFTICMYKRNNMKISEWTSLALNSSTST
jgi:transcriptional regulator